MRLAYTSTCVLTTMQIQGTWHIADPKRHTFDMSSVASTCSGKKVNTFAAQQSLMRNRSLQPTRRAPALPSGG